MKRILFYTILSASWLLGGCKKFLEEKSQDEIRPATIQDLKALMAGSAYPYLTCLNPFLDLMTDDVQCNGGQGQTDYATVVRKGKAPYSWSKNVYEELLLPSGWSNTTYVNTWQIIYEKIAACNTVLGYIDKVSGSDVMKNNLRGQALTLRAYYYFILVNMYGKPYNAPGIDPNTSLGVPLRLRMEVTDSLYPRNSVAEVYTQVERDLKDGLKLMQEYPENTDIFKMNPAAAFALLSRVYLYQEKWTESIAFADSAISKRPALTQLSTYKARPLGGYYLFNNGTTFEYSNRIYDPVLSKEILWCYRPAGPGKGDTFDEVLRNYMFPGYSNVFNPPYSVSNELLSLYETRPISDTAVYLADLRARTYLFSSMYAASFTPVTTYGFKFQGGTNGVGGAGIRTAEVYLNRAEAKIQLALTNSNTALLQEALNDINTLRSSRYDARRVYVPVVITDAQQLLKFCKEERRREFPFDSGQRWFDLRRWGMPSISHFYEEAAGTGQTFTLQQADNRYTLPIPNAVLVRNGMLIQNP